jgi:hypothetical protein
VNAKNNLGRCGEQAAVEYLEQARITLEAARCPSSSVVRRSCLEGLPGRLVVVRRCSLTPGVKNDDYSVTDTPRMAVSGHGKTGAQPRYSGQDPPLAGAERPVERPMPLSRRDGRSRLVERSWATKGAAERALKEALRDRSRVGPDAEIGPETRVAVLAEQWWADYQTRSQSAGTLRLYRGRLDNLILPALGELRVRELTVARVHRHLQAVAEAHGPGSARTTRGVLSGICAFAAQRDALERNPVRDAGLTRSMAPKKLPLYRSKTRRAA